MYPYPSTFTPLKQTDQQTPDRWQQTSHANWDSHAGLQPPPRNFRPGPELRSGRQSVGRPIIGYFCDEAVVTNPASDTCNCASVPLHVVNIYDNIDNNYRQNAGSVNGAVNI